MKKLLSSKKCSPECSCPEDDRKVGRSSFVPRKPNKQTKKPPKPTILPNWSIRNDSSNVSAILHPENYLQSPRRHLVSKEDKILEDKYRGVFKKCCLAKNTCYCKEKNIKPTILPRPNTCLSVDVVGKKLPREDLYRTCLCKDGASNLTDAELLQRYQDTLDKRCLCLKYSQQRRNYDCYIDREQEDEEESIATILGTKTVDTQTASSDLDNMSQFRKEHYFETHSTDDLGKDIPDHTCVHQYKLDDRLLPEPTNVDPYGRSRCTVCNSPKEGSAPSTETYRNVCICDDDSQVELKLDKKDLERFGGFVGRFRRPEYFNTLALRQQKMLGYKRRLNKNAYAADVYY